MLTLFQTGYLAVLPSGCTSAAIESSSAPDKEQCKSASFGIKHSCVYIAALHFLAALPWGSYLSFLSHRFLLCKMWEIIPRSLDCCVGQIERICILVLSTGPTPGSVLLMDFIFFCFFFSLCLENTVLALLF